MKSKQRTYTLLAALLVIFAVLLPIIGTTVAVEVFRPDISAEPSTEENGWGLFFVSVSVAIIALSTLFVTCILSCIAAWVATRLASSAITAAREGTRSVILPRILQVTAIVEVVAAILGALVPFILLLCVSAM